MKKHKMADIENQSIQAMSLRKRKNPHASVIIPPVAKDDTGQQDPKSSPQPTSILHKSQHDHNELIRKINAVTDADMDDEETRVIKKKMMMYQKQSNDAMTNSFMRLLMGIIMVFVIIYFIAVLNEPTDDPSLNNTLLKVLRLLVGIKPNLNYLSSFRIVASTSISKSVIEEFLIPQYPWQKKASLTSKYLVPSFHKSVQHILHETMKLKYERGISVELYDKNMMREFLVNHGQKCTNEEQMVKNSISSIVKKFDELNTSSSPTVRVDAKSLWLWCMMYTGTTFGHLDVDNYIVEMNVDFTKKISLQHYPGGLGNVAINPVLSDDSDHHVEGALYSILSLSTSLLFVSTPKSKIAKLMIEFILESRSFDEFSQYEYFNQLITNEKDEKWTLLYPHCKMAQTDEYRESMIGRICSSRGDDMGTDKGPCCYLLF